MIYITENGMGAKEAWDLSLIHIYYRKWNANGKTVLVIGNEGKGISPLLLKQMDQTLTIPMVGHVQSLNASVATGVLPVSYTHLMTHSV